MHMLVNILVNLVKCSIIKEYQQVASQFLLKARQNSLFIYQFTKLKHCNIRCKLQSS